MAKRGLRYQLEKCLAIRGDWNRIFLRWERSWRELNQFLERRDTKKR